MIRFDKSMTHNFYSTKETYDNLKFDFSEWFVLSIDIIKTIFTPKSLLQLILVIPSIIILLGLIFFTMAYFIFSIFVLALCFIWNCIVFIFSLLNCIRWD